MNLDLTGGAFSEGSFGYSELNKDNLLNTNAQAILYVFIPYQGQFEDIALRPMQYVFDENFLAKTAELTDVSKRGHASHSLLMNDLMSKHNLNDYMTPSYSSDMTLKASKLNDNYRFILILTEKAGSLITGNTFMGSPSNSQIRRIYTGYFNDEPFTRINTFGGKPKLNERAMMIVTHKTIVGTSASHGRFGTETSINMQASEEIVNPIISSSLTAFGGGSFDNRIHLMTPDKCLSSFEDTGNGNFLSAPGVISDITDDNGVNVVPDLLERPGENVQHIVRGMMLHVDEVSSLGRLSSHRNNMFHNEMFGDQDQDRSDFSRHLQLPRTRMSSPFDLDLDRQISPQDLDDLVGGDLDIVDIRLNRPRFYETADQQENSFVNQYSMLLATVVPAILQSAGLNAMQFIYEKAVYRGRFHEDFQSVRFEPTYNVPFPDQQMMAKAVEVELKNGILDTIFRQVGDFHLAVNCYVTGMTTIRLNLVGQGQRNYADFQFPSCLGGLVTPLIGNSQSNAGNTEAVETLYATASGVSKSAHFNKEDRAFEKLANNWADSLPSGHSGFHESGAEVVWDD